MYLLVADIFSALMSRGKRQWEGKGSKVLTKQGTFMGREGIFLPFAGTNTEHLKTYLWMGGMF